MQITEHANQAYVL